MLRNIHLWLPSYIKRHFRANNNSWRKASRLHILFSICDHFEPFWNWADMNTASRRVGTWIEKYPDIASRHVDCLGSPPRHTFFYPIEEYDRDLMAKVAGLCHGGLGEVEVHLHHDNDTGERLREILVSYKKMLAEEHGLLSVSRFNQETRYAFIHGNWALDNSAPDGKWCGVNNEIDILQETGCYADFTMPSAPSDTQTSTVNSIYYAIDRPDSPKSHDSGNPAVAGLSGQKGLLCIQGPLCLDFRSRKFGILPRIENGALTEDLQAGVDRVNRWIRQHVCVMGRPDVIFVKVYTISSRQNQPS